MLISIVTPVYNGAAHLAETIQSVLDQTYPYFEYILVDDCSSDHSINIIKEFTDSRITCIKHPKNSGANAARNNGIRAAKGDVIAFLDQDDIYHRNKLQCHADLLQSHSEIGFTYNGRYSIVGNRENIRDIWLPPDSISLADVLTSTHLLSPSDMVVRKELIEKIGLWNEVYPLIGSEMILLGRLFLIGCRFASTNRILNYRRFYSNRVFSHLEEKCQSELDARDVIFFDPRCPEEVRAERDRSFTNNYLKFSSLAFAQDETALGQSYTKAAIDLTSSLLTGNPPAILTSLALTSLMNENELPEDIMKRIFKQLPQELDWLSHYLDWAIAYRYIFQGIHKLVYGQPDLGKEEILKAKELGVPLDESSIRTLAQIIINNGTALGTKSAQVLLQQISANLTEIGENNAAYRLQAEVTLNLAFLHYKNGRYSKVPGQVLKVIWYQPNYIANRGALSIFVHSLPYILQKESVVPDNELSTWYREC